MRRASVPLLLLLALGCAHRAGVPDLVGTWRLVEYWDAPAEGGAKEYPFGEHPLGFIVYDGAGNVFVQIARNPGPARPPEGYVAYFGTYTVDAARGVVTHHVAADVRGEYTGTDQPRRFRIAGDELIIGDSRRWLRRLERVK